MASDGWVKLHRVFKEWEWYKTPNMVHVFIHLLLSANHEDGKWQGASVLRGQLITGRKSISEATGISEKSIRTSLARLEQTGEISKKSASKYSIITICKYNDYQTVEQAKGPARGQQGASKGPARGHKQEEEECKEVKNKSIVKKPSVFSPPTIEQIIEYCLERKNTVDPEKWHNHYTANGWMVGRSKMKDWKAAVRYWEKNGYGNGKTGSCRSKRDEADEIRERFARELLEANSGRGNEGVVGKIQGPAADPFGDDILGERVLSGSH